MFDTFPSLSFFSSKFLLTKLLVYAFSLSSYPFSKRHVLELRITGSTTGNVLPFPSNFEVSVKRRRIGKDVKSSKG